MRRRACTYCYLQILDQLINLMMAQDEIQMDRRRFYRSRGNMSGFNLMVALRYLSEHHQHHQDLSSGHHESLYEVLYPSKQKMARYKWSQTSLKIIRINFLAPDFMAVRSRWDIKVWDESSNWLFERSRDYKYLPIFTLRWFHEFYLIVCLFLSCARRQARASRQSVCLWWIYTVQLTLWRWCLPTPSGRGTTSLWMLKKTE